MPARGLCRTRNFSDQTMCETCGLTWDINDPSPPPCAPPLDGITVEEIFDPADPRTDRKAEMVSASARHSQEREAREQAAFAAALTRNRFRRYLAAGSFGSMMGTLVYAIAQDWVMAVGMVLFAGHAYLTHSSHIDGDRAPGA